MQKQIQELGDLINNANKILLINHIRMDGDAWGSLGGLALILKEMGKDIECINDSPVPPALQFLGHNNLINTQLDVKLYNPDIIISLDASDTGRLGEVYIKWKGVFDAKKLIVIDHHISNPGFGDINIIDPEASSVCEIITHIIQTLEIEKYVSSKAATFLYTGLQTDSNMYFNTNTRSSTLRSGAALIDLGADFRLPITRLYKERSREQLVLWQYAFENIKYEHEGETCYCSFERKGLDALDIDNDTLGGFFKGLISEIMINIVGIKVAFLVYPLEGNERKVSMRSEKGYNVAQICESFGGGGHKQASGFQSYSENKNIVEELLEKIKKIL